MMIFIILSRRQWRGWYAWLPKFCAEKRIFCTGERWYGTGEALVDEKRLQAHELEKKNLELAKQVREEREANTDLDAYLMPDSYDEDESKRLALMRAKITETPSLRRQRPLSETEKWEQQQGKAAEIKFGAQDRAVDKTAAAAIFTEEGQEIQFVLKSTLTQLADTQQDDEWWNMSLAERTAILQSRAFEKSQKIRQDRESLPVYLFRRDLLKAIKKHPVLIVVGETGSGKTTQIPQYLDEVGYSRLGKIVCTQPRRVAAMSVAARVALEQGAKLGREVGYTIRFENECTDQTKILYMTDGMLLQHFLSDPELSTFSVIMIDEAHERTLHTDILFGLVKDLARHRAKDLRLLISSATLEAEKFSRYFDDAPIFKIPGRKFEVAIYYTKQPEANYIDASVASIMQIHLSQPAGDVLVFLPGQVEIEECQEALMERLKNVPKNPREIMVLTIFSALPSDQQAKIFEPTPSNCRKVILATNIAETSITIDNIVYVIDPGLVKQNYFNPRTGLESLATVACSRASANQRAGRAGRVRPGKCFRLYTELSYQKEMDESNLPEIKRSNICQVVLSLKALGIDDLIHFDFLDPPSTSSLMKSLELLYALGALNELGQLTKMGRRMSTLPGNPQMTKMIIKSADFGCVEEAIIITAMLEISNIIFYRPRDRKEMADNARKSFFRLGGDHLSLLNVYRQWESVNHDIQWCFEHYVQHRSLKRARDIYEQFESLLEKVELEMSTNPTDDVAIRKAITSGYFIQSAKLTKSGQYRTVHTGQTVDIHPSSALFYSPDQTSPNGAVTGAKKTVYRPDTIVYDELVLTSKEYMRNISEIEGKWLLEASPHFFKDKQELIKTAKMPRNVDPKRRL
eukprot:Gregarina_sp_Poly_1__4029@NODE_221_length_11248_cov_177_758072_g195_i0_p1_GENE_NODE_221_length_11248_cov_177_758072_g195_i0NODE_221_length_11248_cov_177_758072_g195_i0_p1_ORF_typecomplete_len860_score136_82Flavi_DEAD/PF07652_14/1_2e27HA2/PF04408_23/1_4e26OB_NTP_bind/PF07717_16/5_7e19DEAD/PF00270_29/1_3e14DEAD/PF00270_29/4_1e03Helicase_C/PF00271_31/7_5e13AAA_19/PF13245_6/2_1e03AAA_19/PF13245_6/1_8e08AAA_22/PF13401_6/2e07AAA_22/PF13401_6/5_1e03ResIII/PF04851_15/1_2e05Herpes_ori_bp/PF02399_15/7_3e0